MNQKSRRQDNHFRSDAASKPLFGVLMFVVPTRRLCQTMPRTHVHLKPSDKFYDFETQLG